MELMRNKRDGYLAKLVDYVKKEFNKDKLEETIQKYQNQLIKEFVMLNKLLINREKFTDKRAVDVKIAEILNNTSFVMDLENIIINEIKTSANYLAQSVYLLRYPIQIFQNVPKNLEGEIHQKISTMIDESCERVMKEKSDTIAFLKLSYNALKDNASKIIPDLENLIEEKKKLDVLIRTK
jgi:S-adenosylmethionine:diacylglycerol 3-amino-3-carboxypropyl transferase